MVVEDPNRPDDEDLDEAIARLERSLLEFKERYSQVRRDLQRQTELQQERVQLRGSRNTEMRSQLRAIERELESLEINLESRLFNWRSLWHPFWQAVRFGGLGIAIGWALKAWAG
ncbi:DUF2203 domain-containing protein [Oscillatoria sp. FACHB-1406]|uniref:DUF2203 domain-containing protein n=1 Tax=Oscillatoria sp. FACHB-1406 TaxID=2692846 RepID=UPI00168468DC|nr:DUF2203 domain-containing protein [Oscillatoria sp. FACHB-1406]MBD2579864.1 DUF2203 domain-containing protein [Oscillatoria sp. FACHB-1406]